MKWILIGLIKGWRAVVSPWYGPCCKYYPSCSAYALEAVQLHGAIKGGALAVWRLLRCNPWSRGGVDPVPGSPLEAKTAEWWGDQPGEAQTEDQRVGETAHDAAKAVMGMAK